MTKTLKKPIAFISAAVMFMTILLYFPSGIFSNMDWGLSASAVEIQLEEPPKDTDGVYQISNAGQLYWFADKVNNENATYGSANAVLTNDITVNTGNVANCNGTKTTGWIDWTPIGNSSNEYRGTFDGQNHTISGLYFNDSSTNNVGLFGYVGSGGSVSNVGVVDSYFSGNIDVGGVCGYNYGKITNCYNTGSVSGSGNVGGVCGENFDSTITNCYNTGSVSGSGDVGGVCGNNNSKITNCYYLAGKASTGIGNGYGSDSAESKTEAQFKSGEVAYLLSQVFTVGSTTYDGTVWGQTLTGEDKQNYPVLGGAKVFATTVCVTYNNSKSSEKAHNFTIITTDTHECKDCGLNERHTFDANSQCTVCKAIKINETTFPDEKFRKWIQSQSYGSDGVLSAGEIAAVTEIDCSNQSIGNLTGIKYFTALKTLQCNSNNLTSLDVSGSSSLETLECTYNNNLTLLNASSCKNLKILECELNGNLTTLDVSGCKFLESLVCNNNKLQSLNLSGCTSLINLTCHTNNLTRLDLKDCKKLYILCCNTNNLTCLDLESMNFTSNDHRLVLDSNTFDIGEVDDEYDLENLIESNGGKFSKVSNVTGATLTADGKMTGFNENGGTITYDYDTGANVSVQENKIMKVTLTYKPAACQHVAGYAKKINVYPSTCVSKGSYTLQTYCGKCNELMSEKRYLTPLAAHTYGDFYDCSDNSHAKECTVCGDTITGAHTFINGSCRDCGAQTVDEYSVNIYFDGKLNKTAVYKSGSVASVSAPAIEGKVFSHWSDTPEGTRKLGTRELFRFYVSGDREIYAIYTDTEVEQEPLVYSSNAYSFVSGVKNYVRFEFTRDIPSAYEVVGHGIIYGNSTTVFGKGDEDSLMRFTDSDYSVLPTKVKYMEFTGISGTGMDYLNVSVGTSKDAVVYARGYAIVRDKTSGETKIIYSDVKSGSFNTLNQ